MNIGKKAEIFDGNYINSLFHDMNFPWKRESGKYFLRVFSPGIFPTPISGLIASANPLFYTVTAFPV